MASLAQSDYETFWRLSQAAHMAEQERDKVGGDGYSHILKVTVQRAIQYDRDTVLEVTRAARGLVKRYTPVDFWYDGYVAGCDRAIHILQGGV